MTGGLSRLASQGHKIMNGTMNGNMTATRLYLELTAHFIDREITKFGAASRSRG